jgi:AbiV family abortive infection protein
MADIPTEAAKKLTVKDGVARFEHYVSIKQEILASCKSLVRANSYEESYQRYLSVVHHVEGLWGDACTLLNRGSHATALALSITCLEEIGKIAVARSQLALGETIRRKGTLAEKPPAAPRKRHPFYSHTQKMLLAAGAGALVNARLDRILGFPAVVEFLERTERGEIEKLRQSALYSDSNEDLLHIPAERITKAQALFHIVLAGELLAEVGGLEPDEWGRLLRRVQDFEQISGHSHE